MKIYLILLLNIYTFQQTGITKLNSEERIYRSSKFGYSILIPKGFIEQNEKGKNTDIKAVDKYGNNIIVVVKEFPRTISFNDISNLLTTDLEKQSPYKIYNVIRKKTMIDGHQSVLIQFETNTDNNKYTQLSYSIPYTNKLYAITITIRSSMLNESMQLLNEIEKSIKFNY